MEELPFVTDHYLKILPTWPSSGKHILGSFNSEGIILYQAYKPSIADWAVSHQSFLGCPEYNPHRMTWLKPNFLWMMYRSGWGVKKDQERILAINVKMEGFLTILRVASREKIEEKGEDCVRLQWDPDHDPFGAKVDRRAIQLGIRGSILERFLRDWIISIHDITPFVEEQRHVILNISNDDGTSLASLMTPVERLFIVEDEGIRQSIGLV